MQGQSKAVGLWEKTTTTLRSGAKCKLCTVKGQPEAWTPRWAPSTKIAAVNWPHEPSPTVRLGGFVK